MITERDLYFFEPHKWLGRSTLSERDIENLEWALRKISGAVFFTAVFFRGSSMHT